MGRPKVYLRFPKTGLGNMLLVWAHAFIFSNINNLKLVTSSWWGFRWGSILRREKKSRFYLGYFQNTSLLERISTRLRLPFQRVIKNPEFCKRVSIERADKTIFLFDSLQTHEEMFFELMPFREKIKVELFEMLSGRVRKELSKYNAPSIAVHIRRGDFVRTNLATPLQYFTTLIKVVQSASKMQHPVTVFSDADISDLEEVLSLPNTMLAEEKPDILDIILMSKAEILVTSRSSSFSYWAAFLSDALVVLPCDDWQTRIREDEGYCKEVRWRPDDIAAENLLKETILNYRKFNAI